MNNKVFNVDIKELIRVLQAQVEQGHNFADFEIEMTDDLDADGTKLVIYTLSGDVRRDIPDSTFTGTKYIDPSKDPDDLIKDLT